MSNPYRKAEQGYYVAAFHNGGEFLFDAADMPFILRHTWHYGKRGYPATHVHGKTVVLHRLLFPDANGEIDHINGNKLDNRRGNMRICTHQQNAFNQRARSVCLKANRVASRLPWQNQRFCQGTRRTNTTGYIGVSRFKGQDCFEAYIHHRGKKYHLGVFPSSVLAARTRDCVAKLVFGEYARLNFPGKGGRRDGKG